MKTLSFSVRNTKEILRDKLNLAFGLGFPVLVLLLLSLIQSNIGYADRKRSHQRFHAAAFRFAHDGGALYSRLYGPACADSNCADGGVLRSGDPTGLGMQCTHPFGDRCIPPRRAAVHRDWPVLRERVYG